MSKIEVDAITEQSGTTLTTGGGAGKTVVVDATTVTLGRCGGTVALASGATQSGFGRTGTVDWITTPKTTGTFTAVSGEGYFLNTSGGVITANLPAGVAGAIVSFADYAATWQTSNVTVVPNGTDKIGSLNENATLDVEGQSVTFVYVDSTQGWINTMDSTSNVRGTPPFIAATGGTITTCGNCKIHTFTGPGTFTVCTAAICAANNVVSYMVIAGGGGGGGAGPSNTAGGGGGAGGFREVKSPVTPYTASPLDGYGTPANIITVTATAFPITVGAGGTGPSSYAAVAPKGSNSSFSSITSAGGGGGMGYCGSPPQPGSQGGSGGGGGGFNPHPGGTGNTPPTSPSQGNPGGAGGGSQNPSVFSGAGGGATATGGSGSGGAGGAGATTSINGTPTARAGGGGALNGAGGAGGGGTGSGTSFNPNSTAIVNTGGGGGGAVSYSGPTVFGGNGGSGIVIIRYKFQ